MAEGTLIYRPSLAQLSYAEELTFNDQTDPTGEQTLLFGLTPDEVALPDPEIDWRAHRSAGYGADVHILTEGPRTLAGSIPIVLQDGRILKYVLGACADTGAPSVYTHTITTAETLPSIIIEAVYNDGTNDFLRYYTGCKCSGATLAAEEEGSLKCNVGIEAALAAASANTKTDLGTLATTNPYMFYEGTCQFWGTTFARIQSWEIDIKRALKPRRYIQSTNGEYPYEINEGVRDITLTATIIAADDLGTGVHGTEAWKELMSPTAGGFDVELKMERAASADDKITIFNPATKKCQIRAAKHPRFAASAEDQPIEVEIIMKGISATVVDAIATY